MHIKILEHLQKHISKMTNISLVKSGNYVWFESFLLLLHTQLVISEVSFYELENYLGLITEVPSNDTCANLPRLGYDKSSSLITNSCIMVYTGENCTSSSIKLFPGSYPKLENVTHAFNQHFDDRIRSFHKCTDSVGSKSGKINVDFYEDTKLIAQYNDICGCVSLPEFTNSVTQLDNHGGCIQLYLSEFGTHPSCTGSSVIIQGGVSYLSENLRNLTHSSSSWKRIMAISPCSQELSKCTKLHATVIKFVIDADPKVVSTMAASSDISMSMTTTFRNNGSAKVAQEYSAKKCVTEATKTTLMKNYSVMEKWNVEACVSLEFTENIPLVSKSTLTASLTSAYSKNESRFTEEGEMRRREVYTEFSVNQKIEIGPCTLYNINSFVKMVNNYPVSYTVYSKVTGFVGKNRLSVTEVKERLKLEDLEYVRDHEDGFSVVAMGQGTMLMDFGVETVIDGAGVPIDECHCSVAAIKKLQS